MVVRFAALMVTVVVLAGCGQKGPLYLPDKGGEVVTRPGGGQPQQPATPDDEQKKKDQQNQQTPRN
jgi:predicted small lipoprotein YifL